MHTTIVCTLFSLMLVYATATITKDNLHEIAGDRPVFLKAYAPWCGNTSPSQMPLCTHVAFTDKYVCV